MKNNLLSTLKELSKLHQKLYEKGDMDYSFFVWLDVSGVEPTQKSLNEFLKKEKEYLKNNPI